MKGSLLFIGISLVQFSCSDIDLEETVESYVLEHNKHNVEEALRFYNSDVVFEMKNVWIKQGLKDMRAIEKWDSTLNSNLKLESVRLKGDTLFCEVIENNDWFAALNVHDLVHDSVLFIVKSEKIKKIIAVPSQSTRMQIENALGPVMEWSRKNQDSTFYELVPNGQFIYSPEAANQWLELFERWKASD